MKRWAACWLKSESYRRPCCGWLGMRFSAVCSVGVLCGAFCLSAAAPLSCTTSFVIAVRLPPLRKPSPLLFYRRWRWPAPPVLRKTNQVFGTLSSFANTFTCLNVATSHNSSQLTSPQLVWSHEQRPFNTIVGQGGCCWASRMEGHFSSPVLHSKTG